MLVIQMDRQKDSFNSFWSMTPTVASHSRMDLDIWNEEISPSNSLFNHIPSNPINFGIPHTARFDLKPGLSPLVPFCKNGYAFQYRPSTVGRNNFLRVLNMEFFGMESEHALYRINSPSNKGIKITRKDDFTILREYTGLPLWKTICPGNVRWRRLSKVTKSSQLKNPWHIAT